MASDLASKVLASASRVLAGLDLEGPGLGLEGPCLGLGLEGPGLVNIPDNKSRLLYVMWFLNKKPHHAQKSRLIIEERATALT